MSSRHRGGSHENLLPGHRGAAGGDIRPRAPQQLGVRPGQGGRAQGHGYTVEVDEPPRVDFSVGGRRQGRQSGVGDRGPSTRRVGPRWLVEDHPQSRRHDHRGFQPGEGWQPHRSHHACHARRWDSALEHAAGSSVITGTDQGGLMSWTIVVLSATLVCLLPGSTAPILAQETPAHPDFTGVYYTFNPNAAARGRAAAPPEAAGARGRAAPPRPVAVIDGREGRPATAPRLTPEYLAKWE